MASTITIRLDDELKKEFETVVNGMGLNMTTAITAFAKATVQQGQIPFTLSYNPLGNKEFRDFINRKLDEGEQRAAQTGVKRYTEAEFWGRHNL